MSKTSAAATMASIVLLFILVLVIGYHYADLKKENADLLMVAEAYVKEVKADGKVGKTLMVCSDGGVRVNDVTSTNTTTCRYYPIRELVVSPE